MACRDHLLQTNVPMIEVWIIGTQTSIDVEQILIQLATPLKTNRAIFTIKIHYKWM